MQFFNFCVFVPTLHFLTFATPPPPPFPLSVFPLSACCSAETAPQQADEEKQRGGKGGKMVRTGLCIKKRLYMGPLRIWQRGRGFCRPRTPCRRGAAAFRTPRGRGAQYLGPGKQLQMLQQAHHLGPCKQLQQAQYLGPCKKSRSRHRTWDLANSCKCCAGTVFGTLQTEPQQGAAAPRTRRRGGREKGGKGKQ